MIVPYFTAGLDLGQASDYTALAILEVTPRAGGGPPGLDCRHLERHLNVAYPAIVSRVAGLMGRRELRPTREDPERPWRPSVRSPPVRLAIDATGVGRPVIDMFTAGDIPAELHAVTITGGHESRRVDWPGAASGWTVPKKELVSTLQAALSSDRLSFAAGLPLAGTLKQEFLNFKAKISVSGHESFEAWRERDHDDLVLAVALAAWVASPDREPPTITYGPDIFAGIRGYG